METHRIWIVGDTIFAEMLVQLLAKQPAIEVVGAASDLAAVDTLLAASKPDAIVYARKSEADDLAFSRFITHHPDLPILCTDLSSNALQIVVSKNIDIHSSNDLLAAIAGLQRYG